MRVAIASPFNSSQEHNMSKYAKLLLSTAVALVAMGAVTGSAFAAEAVVEPAGSIASPSTGKLTFGGSGVDIECELTLNGSLLRGPIRTESNAQIGEITEVNIDPDTCTGGDVAGILGLPWDITLDTTLGSAPSGITGLLFIINDAAFQLGVFGEAVRCLYAGDNGALMGLTRITRVAPWRYTTGTINAQANVLPLVSGGFLCPDEGSMSGAFTITSQTLTVS